MMIRRMSALRWLSLYSGKNFFLKYLFQGDLVMGRLQTNDCLTNELDTQCFARKEGGLPKELGKAGGHKPQPFSLPCYILAMLFFGNHEPKSHDFPCHFLSSGNYYVCK